jgi:hypothetical protein
MLCYAMLRCAMLCYAMLCYAFPFEAAADRHKRAHEDAQDTGATRVTGLLEEASGFASCAMLRYAALCCAMLRYAMLCDA